MSADPRNRRSFSLRTLLSVVTVLAVLLAMAPWIYARYQDWRMHQLVELIRTTVVPNTSAP